MSPLPTSAFPERQLKSASLAECSQSCHAAMAARASREGRPSRWDRTAPAPSRSSSAGRSVPSGHCSPHATTMTGSTTSRSARPTAAAFRRQAAMTPVAPDSLAKSEQAPPLGEGSTTASPECCVNIDRGTVTVPHRELIARGRLVGAREAGGGSVVPARGIDNGATTRGGLDGRREPEDGRRSRQRTRTPNGRPRAPLEESIGDRARHEVATNAATAMRVDERRPMRGD